jgi:hypothetical protein
MAQKPTFDWNNAHPWLRAAHQFGQVNESWFAVKAGSPEHERWAKYFQELGWTPVTFSALGAGKDGSDRYWTAPCQWPEWLTIEIHEPKRRLALAAQQEPAP